MIDSEDEARAYCARPTDASGMGRLERFIELLRHENENQNLISKASATSIWVRHVADSLQLLDLADDAAGVWLDLGSGAGFPGLALAIARPDISMTLVESRKKRIDWLDGVIANLGLSNCAVEGRRLENVETRPIGAITARAFAPLGKLLDLSARFSTRSTVWLLPKGRSAEQELADQPATIRAMFHVEQSQTDAEAAILVGKGRPRAR